MSPAADNTSPGQSAIPLLSRRRGSLASDSTHDVSNGGSDLEQGGGNAGMGALSSNSTISIRVKTAGDGREYKVAASMTATVAEVRAKSARGMPRVDRALAI